MKFLLRRRGPRSGEFSERQRTRQLATPAEEEVDVPTVALPRRPPVSWQRHFVFLGLPAIILLLGSLVFCFTNADLLICRMVSVPPGDLSVARPYWFPRGAQEPWVTLYYVSCWPALILGGAGLAVGLGGLLWSRLRSWGELGWFCCLVVVLGPGLLVNSILKDNWGRARPFEIQEFGGTYAFNQVWQPGPAPKNASFPSGHAAMGFALMAPAFVLYRRRLRLAIAFLLVGLTWGTAIGAARVVFGRHFPSDVLWSAGMIYLTALAVDWGLRAIMRRSACGETDACVA